ncbi:MAG: hypothetical protein FJ125_07800 [Deltaproteobacteria bacterium]|nr:hypothetical protein [Deltaproteobacteria bacterium]
MQAQLRGGHGDGLCGGVISYPLDKLYQEVAYIAYHFHWSLDDVLEMEHKERQIWIREISAINKEINASRK